MSNYILEGKTPKIVEDLREWALWLQKADMRVNKTIITDEIRVSTVFLGMDYSFGDGPPLLFETMIFGGKHDDYMERYCTWEEAEKGHLEAVEICVLGGKNNIAITWN